MGKAVAIPSATLSSLSFAILAYKSHVTHTRDHRLRRNLYASAAISILGIVPFTLVTMASVIGKLMVRAAGSGVGVVKGESTEELVEWWGVLNWARGALPLTGTVLGLWATVW